uniref:NTP pyrophosphohydrolase MazG-like domain-containing protein n=1 Tax=Timspurckia oligopyrenoides TaxID=708627 RepID=A0A7S0ZCG5_9RHOD|mmetsp:Transcript_12371/g.22352  ORF Transcript_12371/g.22352 Transcript_12371/m.22352 type:complete len:166 (+) Transcript_12371:40-537(+)
MDELSKSRDGKGCGDGKTGELKLRDGKESGDKRVNELHALVETVDELMSRCSFCDDVSALEILHFARSEIDEIQLEVEHVIADPNDRHSRNALQTELGDLIFNALLLSAVVERDCGVDPAAAIAAVREKVRRRSPHVFGGEIATSRKEAEAFWQREKGKENLRET